VALSRPHATWTTRSRGTTAGSVAFGSHRKPEAILLPYEVYERYEALSREHARLDSPLAAAQSVQVELPGPFSPDHDREVAAYVDGEREITHAALIALGESPVSPTYDLPHIREIHKRIFGDIYEWDARRGPGPPVGPVRHATCWPGSPLPIRSPEPGIQTQTGGRTCSGKPSPPPWLPAVAVSAKL
jgi:hypothetical protein